MRPMSVELRRVADLAAALAHVREERLDALQAARDAGHTWQDIADAAGMTAHGVRYALANRKGKDR